MTVSSIIPVNNYKGNNSVTTFDFDFLIEKDSELVVTIINKDGISSILKQNLDYSISKREDKQGGYITFPLETSSFGVLKESEVISLALSLEVKQESEFKNSSHLNLNVLEWTFDYIVRIIQILNRKISRAVMVQEGFYSTPNDLLKNINEAERTSKKYAESAEKSALSADDSADKTEKMLQNVEKTYEDAMNDIENLYDNSMSTMEDIYNKLLQEMKATGFFLKDDRLYYIDENGKEKEFQAKCYDLFDLIIKDHKLSYEEKEGLEELGGYVYREGASGVRYGYPEFYKKCMEEFGESEEEKVYEVVEQPYFYGNSSNGVGIKDSRGNTTTLQAIMNGTKEYNQIGEWGTYWIEIGYGREVEIKGYEITADNSGSAEYPSSWEIWGYNGEIGSEGIEAGRDYTLIDSREGIEYATNETKVFNLEVEKGYENYRIVFKSGNGTNGELKKVLFKAQEHIYSIYRHRNGHKYYRIGNLEKIRESNVEIVGGLYRYGNILQGFSANNYAKIGGIRFGAETEIRIKIETGSVVNTEQRIIETSNFVLTLSNSRFQLRFGTTKNRNYTGSHVVEGEKGYEIIIKYDGTKYELRYKKEGEEEEIIDIEEISESEVIGESEIYIGTNGQNYFFAGEVDLNGSYIEVGEEKVWEGTKEKEERGGKKYIDEIYRERGIAWYYGIDEEGGRIKLPRNDYFYQRGEEIGEEKAAGLPEIEGTFKGVPGDKTIYTGAFIPTTTVTDSRTGGSNPVATGALAGFKASLSNDIYGRSNTVQPPSVGVAVYMVVGNTRVNRASSEYTAVTTSENDTLPIFTGMYYDFEPNHVSWVKAGTRCSGRIYERAYNELVNILNGSEQKYGSRFKVAREGEEGGRDYSEYWLINEEEETFRTPERMSFAMIKGENLAVVGNGKSITITNGTQEYAIGIGNYNGNAVIVPWHDTSLVGHDVGETISGANTIGQNNLAGLTQDSEISGLEVDINSIRSEERLYFKVGNAVEEIEIIKAGEVLEELNKTIKKTECKSYISETYANGGSGYRIWSDGWCEQWGRIGEGTTSGYPKYDITLLKEYRDLTFNVQVTGRFTTNTGDGCDYCYAVTTNTISIVSVGYGSYWETEGYLAKGEY